MILDYFVLVIALVISFVSAYYSIVGLTAIFSAAFLPIVVMGGALELGKVVTAVWLRKNWKIAGRSIKFYLSACIIALMLITSMGTFGFLSKAHLEQGSNSSDIQDQVRVYDEKIQNERDTITLDRQALEQMNTSVTQVMGRTSDSQGAERAVAIRRGQATERSRMQKEIEIAQAKISQLQADRAPYAAKNRKVELEVGPIKYIAALVYGDKVDANLLEKAVRYVILIIIMVFDPLSLALILAVNRKFDLAKENNAAQTIELPVEKIVEVDKVIEKTIEVPGPERIVEKTIEVLGPERIIEVEKVVEVEKIVEIPAAIDPKWQALDQLVTDLDNSFTSYELSQLIKTGYGPSFPATAQVQDVWLRTDTHPNSVYQFDGANWSRINVVPDPSVQTLIQLILNKDIQVQNLDAELQGQIKKLLKSQG